MTDSSDGFFVFGASGHGKVVAEIGLARSESLRGFIDDAPWRRGTTLFGVPILAWSDVTSGRFAGHHVALGVGDNFARSRVAARVCAAGIRLYSLVHPRAWVSPSARIGEGTVVMAGAIVNADATIGVGCILNTGSIVEHDARIGNYVLVGPGVVTGGNVGIGDFSLIGVGARILPNVRVGARVRLGGGAVAVRDLPDDVTAIGAPARVRVPS